MIRRVFAGVAAGFLAVTLGGCNTTSGVGHRNPAFDGYRISNVAVDVQPRTEVSDMVEAELVKELNRLGIKAYKTSDITRFEKDEAEAIRKISARGAKELMYVALSDSNRSAVAGYNTSAYAVGSTAYATTIPAIANFRELDARVIVYAHDPLDGKPKIAIEGDAARRAGGLFFIRDSSMISNITDGVIEALKSSGAL